MIMILCLFAVMIRIVINAVYAMNFMMKMKRHNGYNVYVRDGFMRTATYTEVLVDKYGQ